MSRRYLVVLMALVLPLWGAGQIITTFAGTGVVGYTGDGGPAAAARFYAPNSIVFDKSGNMIVGDYGNNVIRKISSAGIVTTIAGTGVKGYTGDGGPATAATINEPENICIDNAGNIYFVDKANSCIRKVNPAGIISTIAGTGAVGYTGDGGPAVSARLNVPIGMAIDNAGNLYVCDDNNYVIRKVNTTTGIITTVAGTGVAGYTGDGGPATAATLNDAGEISVDNAGNIYISDRGNYRIRKISTTGIITTIAGNGTLGYSGDGGPATSASLYFPGDVTFDGSGNIYFGDADNNVIRKIDATGIITTVAGNGLAGYSGDGGLPRCAEFNYPLHIIPDNTGAFYVSDGGNQVIRKMTLGGPVLTISQQPANATVCLNGQVSFTISSPTPGITYQWQASYGSGWYNIYNGTNSSGTFSGTTTSTLTISQVSYALNADQFRCVIMSGCSNLFSSPATLTVPLYGPLVTIQQTPAAVCQGSPVQFTAIPTDGGSTPSYQWTLNGVNVGTNSPIYTDNNPVSGDYVNVTMTSSIACTTPTTANRTYVNVYPILTPRAVIAASSTSICSGTIVYFNTSWSGGGTPTSFQWLLNGAPVGSGGYSYSNSNLSNGDVIKCVVSFSGACLSSNVVTSNAITMSVNNGVVPAVSIAAASTSLCTGSLATFTATPVNGGAAPSYQWMINGTVVSTGGATYATGALVNGSVVSCRMVSSIACTNPAVSNSVVVTVSPTLAPSVSITASFTSICSGVGVGFTATALNGGVAPSYQWLLNGVAVDGSGPTFTTWTLRDGDIVSCVMTSNLACTAVPKVTSNKIAIGVVPIVAPSVSIAGPADAACTGAAMTFAATPVNGGQGPSYQWMVNGVAAPGVGGAVFTSTGLSNGDKISCVMTGNAVCATAPMATSNIVTAAVSSPVTPSVSIAASASPVCAGALVTFTATPSNGGAAPVYQWMVNGAVADGGGAVFSSAALADGDLVTCRMTSSAACVTTAVADAAGVKMTVIRAVTPSVSIAASAGSVCAGALVTFTATPLNGGATPSYQWLVNGVAAAGGDGAVFSTAGLSDGDVVSCVLTAGTACTAPVGSGNLITMKVNAVPLVVLSPDKVIVPGTSVQLTPAVSWKPSGAGTISSYQWTPADGLDNAAIADPVASPAATTMYKLEVVSDGGCTDSAFVTVKVVNGKVGIPNAFTPNGDGHNDIFYISGAGEVKQIAEFAVFNRFGEKVFGVTNAPAGDPDYGWNGSYRGAPVAGGVYVYYAVLVMNDGTREMFKGTVVLVR